MRGLAYRSWRRLQEMTLTKVLRTAEAIALRKGIFKLRLLYDLRRTLPELDGGVLRQEGHTRESRLRPTTDDRRPVEDTATYVLGHFFIFPRQRSSPSTAQGAKHYEIQFSLP